MKRYLSRPALSIAAVITLAACGADAETAAPVGDPTASTPAATTTTAEPSTDVSEEHNDADVMFAQMMIPHHQQAVEMSEIILAKENINPEVTELATQIKDAQGPEIETMTGWLEAWGEPVGGMESHDMGSMGGGMDGMMSEDQMAGLEAAEGEEAARMFLEFMTEHHNGAVDMAQEEIDDGENPEAIALAETIVETQQAEIQEMEELLAEL
ncbi:uncharacterized protein (DUF305 family) [Arthrobacter pigmenti]|uniref:Uncharacterized protein (DUF305 family) n=1 Tax=Arthrobacter pigmenti TaxID=271432 RepID=A0A846RHN6_9MICC|nr:DUF305 domain-containing protein [Arthrobacter pigmenti]NJC22673.1 uncharacterized protein (DUF305 family) [Arthrobacter pigmenti]